MRVRAQDYLTSEEIRELLKKNDWLAAWHVLLTWSTIAASFALVAYFPNVFTVLVALFLIGGKQLACAIIMHDASHRSLFKTEWLNTFAGQWLGAYPIFNDMMRYRPYHLKHHVRTGRADDPDINLTKGYPTTRASFARKVGRDLSGATALKANYGLLAMHLDYLEYSLGGLIIKIDQTGRKALDVVRSGVQHLAGPILANLALVGILWATGNPWLYLLWIGAYFSTYNFSLRVRSIAEHSIVPDREDDRKNTRTTYANVLEQFLFAPLHVNYHAEHHLLMTVPCYNLPKMHKLLLQRGYFEEGVLERGYLPVLKLAMSRKPRIVAEAH
jgi:fatty acid desaturase